MLIAYVYIHTNKHTVLYTRLAELDLTHSSLGSLLNPPHLASQEEGYCIPFVSFTCLHFCRLFREAVGGDLAGSVCLVVGKISPLLGPLQLTYVFVTIAPTICSHEAGPLGAERSCPAPSTMTEGSPGIPYLETVNWDHLKNP